jgi:hypothetical protein
MVLTRPSIALSIPSIAPCYAIVNQSLKMSFDDMWVSTHFKSTPYIFSIWYISSNLMMDPLFLRVLDCCQARPAWYPTHFKAGLLVGVVLVDSLPQYSWCVVLRILSAKPCGLTMAAGMRRSLIHNLHQKTCSYSNTPVYNCKWPCVFCRVFCG